MPRIKVHIRIVKQRGSTTWLWRCTQHPHDLQPGQSVTTARSVRSWPDAITEGLAHLAEHHTPTVGTYCRAHGCQRVQCGCALGDQNGAFVAPRGHTERSTGSSDRNRESQIHICTKCGLVSTCNNQSNGARA